MTGGAGDWETGRLGDWTVTLSPCHPVAMSSNASPQRVQWAKRRERRLSQRGQRRANCRPQWPQKRAFFGVLCAQWGHFNEGTPFGSAGETGLFYGIPTNLRTPLVSTQPGRQAFPRLHIHEGTRSFTKQRVLSASLCVSSSAFVIRIAL